MDEQTRRVHRLLSDGKLSGPEAEEILQNVLAAGRAKRVVPARVRAMRYWAGAGAVLAAAAAAAVMLIVNLPREPGGGVHVPEEGELSGLRVRCSPGELEACPASSKLVFSVSGEGASGFLSAYAERVGDEPMRTFLYSKEDGSAELRAGSAARPVGLPGPGRHRICGVIADRPLTRAELVGEATGGTGGAEVRARLQVEIVVGE